MSALANEFCDAGFGVDLVLQKATGPYLKDVREGVTVVNLNTKRLMISVWPLIQYIRKARPSAMLSTPLDASIVAILAWTAVGTRARLVVREAITASSDDQVVRGLRARIIALLRRRAYRRASHVVAPSVGVAEDLITRVGVPRAQVSVIANPLDTDLITTLASAPLEQLSLPAAVRVIVAAGRLSAQKDFATLIRAFSAVRRARDVVLVILGEGEERPHLSRLAAELGVADKVVMPGFVENPFSYMKRASVFVLSSRYEGLPNALLQALAVGTAVVATDCPSGPSEILEGGRWGRLVPVSDVEAMARAIVDGLDGKLERPPLSMIIKRYGLETIAAQYLEVLLPDRQVKPARETAGHDAGNRSLLQQA